SLFKVKINWGLYLCLMIFSRLLFPEISWYSYTAIMISAFQFLLLFYSIGSVIPVRYLLGSFMCLQMFVGPTLAYNGLDQYQRGFLKMQIPEEQYFLYVIPAVICFILGLHIRAGMLEGEVVDLEKIKRFVKENPKLPYFFIGIGFVSSFVSGLFGAELGFVFTLLACFKFIGTFLIILSGTKLRPLFLFLVYGSVIASSLGNAMFHDLLTWLVFLGSVLAIKYKPTVQLKAIVTFGFILLAITIQLVKGDYREATWKGGEETGLETLQKTVEESKSKSGFFSMEKLGTSNVRINQGFIITNIMSNIPARVPFAKGEEMAQIFEAAIMPRILAPNKLNAGDRDFFMKYSGMPLAEGTSMGLSSVGDAYINFGVVGGALFMLLYGMFFSEVLKAFNYFSPDYPILILFTAMVFYFPIRPDCELQTILGHLIKSCFLIFVMIQIWNHVFKVTPTHYRFIPQE
ncbi:MAG: hypothetical protein NTZ41_04640, partial [Sphingobacteriales bacterium]|nr:hypothetical protein [Sphingobacteriales bacterium]